VVVTIMVMIVVVVSISVVASGPRVFQVPTAALCLAAVFPMFALRIVQFALRCADSVFALPVIIVITVHRPRGNRSAQK
jgi:hypothetical protein